MQRCGSEIIAVASELRANHRNSFWIVMFVKTDGKEKQHSFSVFVLFRDAGVRFERDRPGGRPGQVRADL